MPSSPMHLSKESLMKRKITGISSAILLSSTLFCCTGTSPTWNQAACSGQAALNTVTAAYENDPKSVNVAVATAAASAAFGSLCGPLTQQGGPTSPTITIQSPVAVPGVNAPATQ